MEMVINDHTWFQSKNNRFANRMDMEYKTGKRSQEEPLGLWPELLDKQKAHSLT